MPVGFILLAVGGEAHGVLQYQRGSGSFLYTPVLLERIFLKTEALFMSVSAMALTPLSVLNKEYVALH